MDFFKFLSEISQISPQTYFLILKSINGEATKTTNIKFDKF